MQLRPSPAISASFLEYQAELKELTVKQKAVDQAVKEKRPLPPGLTVGDLTIYRECILQRKDCLRDQCALDQTLSELFSYQVLAAPEEEPYVVLRTRRDYLTKKVRECAKLNPIWVEKWQSVKAPIEAWMIEKKGQNEKASRDYRSPLKLAFRSALIANRRACNAELIAWVDVNAPPELRERYKSNGNREGSIRVAFERKRSKYKHTIEVTISQVRKDMGIPTS